MIYLKTSIGIEMREGDMLLASLQGNFSDRAFTHYRRIPDYVHRDALELRREIQHFFKTYGLGKDTVVLGIPRSDIILRRLDLPAEVADNLKQVIRYQVQSFEPTEEESYYYDYTLLDGGGGSRRLSVLLALVRKDLLDGHLQFLMELGIRPTVVTSGSLALANLLLQDRKNMQDKTHILADAAPSSLELMVLHQGTLAHSDMALKDGRVKWKDLILKEIDEAASKIRLGPESSIEKIILTGESSEAAYEELREDIAECTLIKDAVPLKCPPETKIFIQEAATSAGLAFTGMTGRPAIGINLLPDALRFKQTRWAYAAAAVFALAAVAFLAGLLLHRQIQDRQLVRQLDREIDSLKPSIQKVQALRKETEQVQKEVETIEKLFREKDKNLESLRELTSVLPEDTYLTNYVYRDATINIAGQSGSASDLIANLENSRLFQDAVQRGPTTRNPRTGKDTFAIEVKLEE
jgi:Tfp pilus assembly protein PilN